MPEQNELSHASFLRTAALSRLIAQVVLWINCVFLVLALVGQIWPRVILLIVSAIGFIACIHFSHASRYTPKISWLLLAACWCSIINAALTNGAGLGHVTLSWFAILVCMAGLLGGARFGVYWAVIGCLSILIIIVCEHLGVVIPNFTPNNQRYSLILLHTFAQMVCILSLVIAYSRTQAVYEHQVEEQIAQVKTEVEQRKKAELHAQVSAKNKEQFLRNISHEFRTPLNSIIGFSERLLKKCDESSSFVKPLAAINRNGKSLHYFVNELLLLDAIEATPMQLSRIALAELISGSCEACRELATKHQLDLQLTVDDDCKDSMVDVDVARMTQALNNILLFCVRQSASLGEIQIRVKRLPESLILEYEDNAPALTPSQREHIFETHYEYVLLNDKDVPCSAFTLKIASLIMKYHQWGLNVIAAETLNLHGNNTNPTIGDLSHAVNNAQATEQRQGNCFVITVPSNVNLKQDEPCAS